MKKTFSLLLALIMTLSLFTAMPFHAMADEKIADVTLSTTKVSVMQFEYSEIKFTYGEGTQGALSFKSDNGNAYAQTITTHGVKHITVVGLKVGKCKIKVYTGTADNNKKLVGTINVTVKKNGSYSTDKIKKQLKKSITVKQYAETEIHLLKNYIEFEYGWYLDFSYPKNSKIYTADRTSRLGDIFICSKKKGTVKVNVYAYPKYLNNDTGTDIIKKGVYIGKMEIKTTAAKNTLIKKNITLRYQKSQSRQAFDLNRASWKSPSKQLGQKIFIKDILGKKYDKKSVYTIKVENGTIVKYSQFKFQKTDTDMYLYGYSAGNTTVKIYQKQPKKDNIKVAEINVTVDDPITLADISDKWYEERLAVNFDYYDEIGDFDTYPTDKNDLNINKTDQRVFVLLSTSAPLYDTYRVKYESLYPDYVKVEADGTLNWKKDPIELTSADIKTVKLIRATLSFVDGSQAVYHFTYTTY